MPSYRRKTTYILKTNNSTIRDNKAQTSHVSAMWRKHVSSLMDKGWEESVKCKTRSLIDTGHICVTATPFTSECSLYISKSSSIMKNEFSNSPKIVSTNCYSCFIWPTVRIIKYTKKCSVLKRRNTHIGWACTSFWHACLKNTLLSK